MARTDEFEEFTKKGGRASGRVPMLRIRKSGRISLSKAAFDLLGQPKYVVFSYARIRHAIGIKPATKRVSHAYQVTQEGSSSTYVISGRTFLRDAGIAFEGVSQAYRVHMETGMLVADLAQGLLPGKGR